MLNNFVDNSDVCVFSILEAKALAKRILVADWYHMEGDRIASIQTVFDTRPFASRSVESSDGSAVDPVCHMNMSTAGQPLTRSWANTMYLFCSEGCARAFEIDPNRYTVTGSVG